MKRVIEYLAIAASVLIATAGALMVFFFIDGADFDWKDRAELGVPLFTIMMLIFEDGTINFKKMISRSFIGIYITTFIVSMLTVLVLYGFPYDYKYALTHSCIILGSALTMFALLSAIGFEKKSVNST